MAWDFPPEQAATHCCRKVESFDHWFLRFRWAAGLHSLIEDDDDDKLAGDGDGDGEASDREEDAGDGEAGGGNCEALIALELKGFSKYSVDERRFDAGGVETPARAILIGLMKEET